MMLEQQVLEAKNLKRILKRRTRIEVRMVCRNPDIVSIISDLTLCTDDGEYAWC
ncbi:hypothetical protein PHMEG_00040446 [Phytophthora megakarya]|uniref:Uncharacterized protein n=1 Tax=Phytophthora megakarya TaxID=4795 RepID=A0A225UDR3_9STRA|nr:hypothetical protein PHMEG_00040446 [Phytophthora megakarya]